MVNKHLTSTDVAKKKFTAVRLREGYSSQEVKAFMKLVEESLRSNEAEIKNLQKAIENAAEENATTIEEFPGASPGAHVFSEKPSEQELSSVMQPPAPAPSVEEVRRLKLELKNSLETLEKAQDKIAMLEQALEQAKHEAESAPAASSQNTPTTDSITSASVSAARMLEMASRQHDELLASAQAQADELLGEAKAVADAEKERLDEELATQLAQAEEEMGRMEARLLTLRRMEEESRVLLTVHFTERLEELKNPLAGMTPDLSSLDELDEDDAAELQKEQEAAGRHKTSTKELVTKPTEANKSSAFSLGEEGEDPAHAAPEMTEESSTRSKGERGLPIPADDEIGLVEMEAGPGELEEPEAHLSVKDLNSYPSFFNEENESSS